MRKDLLEGCRSSINIQSTEEEFKMAFCDVCINPECVRSGWAESSWLSRMNRQEKALWEPYIVDPNSRPEFLQLSRQNFETLTAEERSYYGGWVSIGDDGKIIHHAEPETSTTSDKSLQNSLEAIQKSKQPSEDSLTPEELEEEIPLPPFMRNFQDEEQDVEEELKEDIKTSTIEIPKEMTNPKNTEPPPKEGIMLGNGSNNVHPNKRRQLVEQMVHLSGDSWGVPSEAKSKSRVTVRVTDGKVMKKE